MLGCVHQLCFCCIVAAFEPCFAVFGQRPHTWQMPYDWLKGGVGGVQGQELCVEGVIEAAWSWTWSSCLQAGLAESGSGKAHQHPNPNAALSAPMAGIDMYSSKAPEGAQRR